MALVDLFCCGGGFSLGAHRAGFDVAAAYDLDPILTSSFRTNFPNTDLALGDISQLTGSAIRERVGGRIDGIFGGPPCQGFSDIGRQDVNDPRRKLLGHFFRIVKEVEPDFFIMENVKGLQYERALPLLENAITDLGGKYNILGPMIFNAADFGAATTRRRLFVIGTHSRRADPILSSDFTAVIKRPATVKEAIIDLVAARALSAREGFDRWKITKLGRPGSYAGALRSADGEFTSHRLVDHRPDVVKRWSEVPQGGLDAVGRHPRLAWEGQCPTLRAGTGADKGSYQAVRPLHPDEHRVITVREAARLQGFPDDHYFHPTIWHSFRMIGNSVSPIIAEAMFEVMRSKFDARDQERTKRAA